MTIFFAKDIAPGDSAYTMDEATSRHCVQVLRHTAGDTVLLADGKGGRYTARITDDHRKRCTVSILQHELLPPAAAPVRIAISFTKNASRTEWFLEKATEIGVQTIIPLLSQRTEKEKFRADRFGNILVAAMLQSQQYYLPVLTAPQTLEEVLAQPAPFAQQFIAHCLPGQKTQLWEALQPGRETLMLIGPEGDFTPEEVALALAKGCIPVSLGNTRLRTETAGIVACAIINSRH